MTVIRLLAILPVAVLITRPGLLAGVEICRLCRLWGWITGTACRFGSKIGLATVGDYSLTAFPNRGYFLSSGMAKR